MKLVVATRNRGKLAEIAAALSGLGIELLGLDAFPDAPEVVEDGATFEENALKKARQIAAATNCLTLADDSGLEVAALGGRPGVYSARFAGPGADDAANNDRLLRELHSVPEERRQATFRCVLAVCTPEGRCATCQGALRGAITREPRGDYGFGYDPLFVPEGFPGRTISELGAEVKAAVSHRAQALAKVRGVLEEILKENEGNSGRGGRI